MLMHAGEPAQVTLPAGHVGSQKPFEQTAQGDASSLLPASSGGVPESEADAPASLDVVAPESSDVVGPESSVPESLDVVDPESSDVGPESWGVGPESSDVVGPESSDVVGPESSDGVVASVPGTVASGVDEVVASTPESSPVGGPASSVPVGRFATVVPSATNPWLKCVTWALTADPETLLGRMPNVVELGFVHANAGVLPLLMKFSWMVTGLLKTRPAGPNW
jgi:hypothetical protein